MRDGPRDHLKVWAVAIGQATADPYLWLALGSGRHRFIMAAAAVRGLVEKHTAAMEIAMRDQPIGGRSPWRDRSGGPLTSAAEQPASCSA